MALAASTLASGSMKRSRKPYTYERLSELRLDNSPVNVMGVAVLFKPPYQSKGRDFTCTVEIVDEGSGKSSVPLIFFNREKGKLPREVKVGDVVCVRRMEVGEFNHRMQGRCRSHSSWLVWDSQQGGGGGGGGGRAPTLTSEGASWDSHEMTRAGKLITWSISGVTGELQWVHSSPFTHCFPKPFPIITCEIHVISSNQVTQQHSAVLPLPDVYISLCIRLLCGWPTVHISNLCLLIHNATALAIIICRLLSELL